VYNDYYDAKHFLSITKLVLKTEYKLL